MSIERSSFRVPVIKLELPLHQKMKPGHKENVVRKYITNIDLHVAYDILHETLEVSDQDTIKITLRSGADNPNHKPYSFELNALEIDIFFRSLEKTKGEGVFVENNMEIPGKRIEFYWKPE